MESTPGLWSIDNQTLHFGDLVVVRGVLFFP